MERSDVSIERILITNVHSYWNAGDAALTDVSLTQLADAFPDAYFTMALNDPDSYTGTAAKVASFATWFKDTQNRWIWWSPLVLLQALMAVVLYRLFSAKSKLFLSDVQYDLLKAYFEADLVVSCAGNFLYTSGRIGLPFVISVLGMAYGVWSGKPLYAMPQSVGPISRRWQHALIRWVICKSRIFMIRDTVSWTYLDEIKADKAHTRLMPDVAFDLPDIDEHLGAELLRDFGVPLDGSFPLLGVTVINWAGQQRAFSGQETYEAALVAALSWFIETYHGKVVFFPQVCGPTIVEDDRVAARRVATQLKTSESSVSVIERICDAPTLMSAYGYMDVFLGTRLHSCIFAMKQGVPVLPIAYQHKTIGILAMLDIAVPVLPITEVTADKLIHALRTLYENKQSFKTAILDEVAKTREQAHTAGRIIVEDLCR